MAVSNIVPLSLRKRSGQTDPHQMADGYAARFVLGPKLVEGSKHEWKNGHF